MRLYGINDIDVMPQLKWLSAEERFAMKVVSTVLPFRTNNYVIEELIDWENIPDDPIYQLTFPQKGMLRPEHFERLASAFHTGAPRRAVADLVNSVRAELNPHPEGQLTDNVPILDEQPVAGVQHKYPETCLIFPASGQTCHAHCTYCFRWPQFIGIKSLKFATDESKRFEDYIKRHKDITDVLITGGDPMIMKAERLKKYLEPLLSAEFEHIQTIRIGTKSVAYWPYRYVTDKDADDVLRLFEEIVRSGKHLAIMAHCTHWKELSTLVARQAIRRIRDTGAVIRTQSPIVRHVNDSPHVWVRMWREQVQLGCVPYYMFVARDTGANHYFAISLHRAYQVFSQAFRRVSGLGRTVRGPSMSAHPGKVVIEGMADVYGERVFVLTLLQARNPDWCKRPTFAKFDPNATWLDQLQPAFGEGEFFYEAELRQMYRKQGTSAQVRDLRGGRHPLTGAEHFE